MDKCTCTMAQKTVGDGCRYCNPQYAIDMLIEQDKDNTRASDEVIRGLVEALGNITNMAIACNWESYTTGRQLLLADAEKALAQARSHLGE